MSDLTIPVNIPQTGEVSLTFMSAPWSDTGQNFLISRGGVIMEGRHGSQAAAGEGRVVRGAHANNVTYNKTWHEIELEGNYYSAYEMTPQQWESLVDLCAWLVAEGAPDPAKTKGHQGVTDSSTACPGKLMEHLDELRAEVAARAAEIRLEQ